MLGTPFGAAEISSTAIVHEEADGQNFESIWR
jgi:hypothetical protein